MVLIRGPSRPCSIGWFYGSQALFVGKPVAASADDPQALEAEKKLAAAGGRVAGDKTLPADEEDEDSDDELEFEDDEDDEELVVYTAKEAAGALATIYGFVKPFLKNYKKILAFVCLGVLVETLFNVIMPLSLKFLIDDALGEEDFDALIKNSLGAGGGRHHHLDRRGLVRAVGRQARGFADFGRTDTAV